MKQNAVEELEHGAKQPFYQVRLCISKVLFLLPRDVNMVLSNCVTAQVLVDIQSNPSNLVAYGEGSCFARQISSGIMLTS